MPNATFDPVPAPRILPRFKVQPVFRIVSWEFLEKPDQWHATRSAHAHLGCAIIEKWRTGGCAKHHARSGRRGPPEPASVTLEHHVPVDIPGHLRCAYCWGPARNRNIVPTTRWWPHWDEPWWPYTIIWGPGRNTEIGWKLDRWEREQMRWQHRLWIEQYGGIYEREVIVLAAPRVLSLPPLHA